MAKKKVKGGGSSGQTATMGLITVQLESGVDPGLKDVKKTFNELSKSGTKWADNLKKYVLQSEKSFNRMHDEMYKKEKEIKALRVKLGKEELDETGKARLKQLKQERKAALDNMQAIAKKRAELHKEAMEYSKKEYAQKIADTAKATESALEKIKSMDASIFSDFGSYLQKRGAQLEKKSLDKGGKGITGKGVMGMGAGLIKGGIIGAALIGLGKVLIDLTDKFSKMNKEISESGLNIGALATAGYDVATAFKTIRESFFLGEGTLAFNNLWGTKPEEHYKILGSFEQAGYDIREMVHGIKEGADQMERFRQISVTAMTYGKLAFGSNEEAASSLAEVMDDFGYSLEGAAQQMAGLYEEAVRSGFGTKRFFSTVLQATSGMSMYNVRLSETAALLGKLARFTNNKNAEKLLTGTLGKLSGMSYEERIKVGMILGKGQVSDMMTKALDSALANFYQTVKSSDRLGVLSAYMAKHGDISTSEQFSKVFKGLNDQQRSQVYQHLNMVDPALGTQWGVLDKLLGASKSGMAGQMTNLHLLDPGTALGMINRFSRTLAKTDLDMIPESDIESRLALREVFNITEEEFDQYTQLFGRMRAFYRHISEFAKSGKTPDQDMLRYWATQGLTIKNGKVTSATLDTKGNVVAGDKEIGSFQDFIEFTGASRSDLPEIMDENVALAQDIAHATTTMADILDNTVSFWLAEISEGINALVRHFLGKDMSPEDKLKWEQILERSVSRRKMYQDELKSVGEQIISARGAYNRDPSVANFQKLEELRLQKEMLKKQLDMATNKYANQRKVFRNRLRGGGSNVFKTDTDIAEHFEFEEEDLYRRGGLPHPIMGDPVLNPEDIRDIAFRKARKQFPMTEVPTKRSALEQAAYDFLKSSSSSGAVDPEVHKSFVSRWEGGKLTPAERESLEKHLRGRSVPLDDPMFRMLTREPTEGSTRGRGNTTIINITSSSTDEIIAQIQKVVSASASGIGGP